MWTVFWRRYPSDSESSQMFSTYSAAKDFADRKYEDYRYTSGIVSDPKRTTIEEPSTSIEAQQFVSLARRTDVAVRLSGPTKFDRIYPSVVARAHCGSVTMFDHKGWREYGR